ncbi:hypothetical protein N8I77_012329 [Diaporthe amygdali]|uniref:Uncharacterized protein n=1 Tax=Phomopsis amygdali TaxID=1214568 RepID=A0AAD9S3B7_PHOAM|nr:hypothetical protein N8I77_012329 [Diaporthe amygdali]
MGGLVPRGLPLPLQITTYDPSWSYFDEETTSVGVLAEPLVQSVASIQSLLGDIEDLARLDTGGAYVSLEVSRGGCVATSAEAARMSGANCSSICMDPTTLFLPFNLGACVGVGTAAMLIQNGSLSLDGEDKTTARAADSLGVVDFSVWNGRKVIQDLVTCAVASCTTNNVAACPEETLALEGVVVDASNLQTIYDGLSVYCDNIDVQVDSDIAGPGVMVSYLLQVCTALFLWVVVKLLTSWTRVLIWPFCMCKHGASLPGFSLANIQCCRRAAWLQAAAIQDRLARSKLHAVTISTLVEFQEVQAWFVGAIQVATLATFQVTGGSALGSANTNSFGEAILSSRLVRTLAFDGIYPILLAQFILQQHEMRWWYSFILVLCNFALAMAVKARVAYRVADFDVLWAAFKDATSVDACGGNPNPMVYCNTFSAPWDPITMGTFWVYSVMALLVLDFFVHHLRDSPWIRGTSYTLERANGPSRWWAHMSFWRPVLRGLRFFHEYILVLLAGFYFVSMLVMTSAMRDSLGNWSYGQLVAVTVWVPTLTKFLYYNIFGIEEGIGRRLTDHYKVVHNLHDDRKEGDDTHNEIVDLDDVQKVSVRSSIGPTVSPASTIQLAEPIRLEKRPTLWWWRRS